MRNRFALASSLAFLAFASTALAGDAPAIRDPWTSFGVGTSVTSKTSTKTTIEIEGMPTPPDTVSESRLTLTAMNDSEYTLKREFKIEGEWKGDDLKFRRGGQPQVSEGDKVELGVETITIDGISIECKKTKTIRMRNVTTSWTNERHGLVRSESNGGGMVRKQMLTKLSKKVTVAGKEYDCREMTYTWSDGRGETVCVSLLSDKMPGELVRSDTIVKTPEAKMTSVSTVEVLAVAIK